MHIYLQEYVRIFELKKLATQEMQRAKKTKMYNQYRGNMTEHTVTKKLAEEYNTKARVQADEDLFSGVEDWEHYLQGKLKSSHISEV